MVSTTAEHPSDVSISCLDRDGFARLASEWPSLLRRTGHEAPFYRHELLRAWVDAFAPEAPLHVVVARDGGGLRAALCLVERRARLRGVPVRMLCSTSNVYSERFDLIAQADDDAAIDAIWRHVRHGLRWHVLELRDVPARAGEGEGAAHALVARAAKDGPTGAWLAKEVPFVSLPATLDELFAGRGDFRRNLRRRRARLAGHGVVTHERVTGGLDLEARLEEGFALEASGWKGRAGTAVASEPRVRAFYAEVAREAAAHGYLALHFLRVDGRAVAFHFGLEQDGRYYLPKLGIDDEWRSVAPGHLLVEDVLRDGAARGLETFDFLGPDMPWKREWASRTRPHHYLYAFRDTLVGRALHAAKFRLPPLVRRLVRRPRGPRRPI